MSFITHIHCNRCTEKEKLGPAQAVRKDVPAGWRSINGGHLCPTCEMLYEEKQAEADQIMLNFWNPLT